jgi:sugar phosphate isomerase/epimerase
VQHETRQKPEQAFFRTGDAMQIGVFAKTYPETNQALLARAIAADGFAAVHYNLACLGLPSMPEHVDATLLDRAARIFAEQGLRLVGLSSTYNMIHPDRARRADGLRQLDVVAAAAARLGVAMVSLCTGTRHPTDQWADHPDNQKRDAWRDLLIEIEHALVLAERHGIILGIEPELANVVRDAKAARRLLDHFRSERLKIILDPANLSEIATEKTRRHLVEEAVDLLGPDIIMAHAKDRKSDGAFCAAGQGVIDFRHFVTALRRAGFDGPLITHGLSAAEAPMVARFLADLT